VPIWSLSSRLLIAVGYDAYLFRSRRENVGGFILAFATHGVGVVCYFFLLFLAVCYMIYFNCFRPFMALNCCLFCDA